MNAMIKWYPYFFIFISLLIAIYFLYEQKKFHRWIFTYWGKKPTLTRNLQLLTYLLSLILFLGSLADWRGDETTIQGKKTAEKTVILIDNSLSMLAEDVRPNRFEKAILMARHFIKAAPGHEIAVILFSDVTRKYVPFTTDIDLLDARITGLKELYKNIGGSSNIKQAIREGLDNLDANPLTRKGNILLFSDAEGMDEDFPLEVGPSVSVAVIAIGTASGAPIPVRGRDGVLQGYKMFEGQQVTSKVNQTFLDSLSTQIKNYKYWVVSSFSLPTPEVLEFFQNKGLDGQGENQNMRAREVLYEWWLIPAILLFIISLIIKRTKTWTITALLLFFSSTLITFTPEQNLFAQDNKVKDILPLMDALRQNQLDDKGRLSIAQKLLEAGDAKKAQKIYQEALENKKISEENKYSWLNYAQALAANKKSAEAISKMLKIQEFQEEQQKKNNKTDREFEKKFSENMLSLLQSQEQQQQQQKDKKEQQEQQQQDKNDQQDQQNNQSGDGEQNQDQEGDQKQDQKNDQGKEDNKDKKEKENKDQNQNPKDQKDNQEGDEPQKSRSERQKELSSLLKQLLNEDRSLQQKLMETTTKDPSQKRGRSDGAKDW